MLFANKKRKNKFPTRLPSGQVIYYGVIPLLLFIVLLLSSCSGIKAPVSQFNKYELKQIGLSKAILVFYFDIENPNDIPLGIKDINYSVQLDGNKVVTGTNEGFSMSGREKKLVQFPVELSYTDLARQALNLAKKFIMRNGNVQYKIDGQLSIIDNIGMSARVPLLAEGEIKLF